MSRAFEYAWTNRKVVILTFEVFWTVVVILDAATAGNGHAIAQFVYVNF